MKAFFDLFPVLLFFVAFKFAGIFVATAVAIAATVAQIGWALFRGGKVSALHWASLVIVGVFGGATLVLQDETFIKWKPTVLYGFGGIALFVALAFGRNPIRAVMKEGLALPDHVWKKLGIAWGVFLLFLGALNLYVAFNYPTETWVNFKVFGGMGLMIVFVVAQAFWMARYLPDEEPPAQPKAEG